MVMEDTGAMVTDVLDEPELRPLWGGIVRRGARHFALQRCPGARDQN
jgi:hypothetical protein